MNQNLSVKTAKQQRVRRRRQRPARQQKKAGKATVKRTVVQQVVTRRRRRNRQGRRGATLNGGGVVGIGNTRGQSMGKNSMTVSESEFVAAVTVANQPNFNNVAYAINPGNATLFPWLSTIAGRFEKYTFTRLNFVYKKEVSEFNTAGSAGKVMMSVDFDASDPAPTTKQQIEDTVPHSDAMPSQSFGLSLGAKDLAHPNTIARYVRTGGLPGASDIKTYDVGNFNIATQGVTQNVEIGELHVNYTVKFEKPVLEATAAPANNQVTQYQSATDVLTTATAHTMSWGTTDTNGLSVANAAGVLTPTAGNYLFIATLQFAASGENVTSWEVDIEKNSTPVKTNPPTMLSGVGTEEGVITDQAYISCNGTDAIRVRVVALFASGTCQAYGTLTILAV